MQVLIIEDCEITLESVKKAFKGEDFKVFLAQDGIEGISILKDPTANIDVIVSDYNMPLFNGIQVAKKIRDQSLSNAPFIMITSEVSSNLKAQGKELGVKAWITKPADPKMVVKIALDLINKHS